MTTDMNSALTTFHDQQERVKQFFDSADSWKGRMYSDGTDRFDQAMVRRKAYMLEMVKRIDDIAAGRSLDIGCGCGVYSSDLAALGFEIYGVDVSDEMIAECRKNLPIPAEEFGKRFMTSGAEKLAFASESFDLVIAVGLFGYLLKDDDALREIMRVLKPGGYFFLSVQNIASLSNFDYALRQTISGRRKGERGGDGTALPVPWVTTHSSTGLFYKSYIPWKLKKKVASGGCTVIDELSLGYEFRIVRRLHLLPDRVLTAMERGLERFARKFPVAPLKYSGDTYSILFRKNN